MGQLGVDEVEPVEGVAGVLDAAVHVGKFELDRLKVADPLTELLPLPGVVEGAIEGALRNPQRLGGDEVGLWAKNHGFRLPPDAPEVLDFYADRSPIFMAAAFDADAAAARGQAVGDGTPVHLTIPTDNPWVPLHILGLGKADGEIVGTADAIAATPINLLAQILFLPTYLWLFAGETETTSHIPRTTWTRTLSDGGGPTSFASWKRMRNPPFSSSSSTCSTV